MNNAHRDRAARDMAEHFNASPDEAVAALREAMNIDLEPVWWLMGFAQGWFAALEREGGEPMDKTPLNSNDPDTLVEGTIARDRETDAERAEVLVYEKDAVVNLHVRLQAGTTLGRLSVEVAD